MEYLEDGTMIVTGEDLLPKNFEPGGSFWKKLLLLPLILFGANEEDGELIGLLLLLDTPTRVIYRLVREGHAKKA